MLHVDEGALHAYLDGALDEYPLADASRIREHLDQCAECAERLEIERRVRSDAHAVLALAAPEMDLPSLEELRAYVKRTRPERSKSSIRMVRMGWAASVALALGTGYILRDGQLALQSPSMDAAAGASMEAVSVAAPASGAVAEAEFEADDQASTLPNAVGSRDLASQVGAENAVAEDRFAQEAAAEPAPQRESLSAPTALAEEVRTSAASRRVAGAAPAEVVANRALDEVVAPPPAAPDMNIERFNDSVGGVVASADVLEAVADPSEAAEELAAPADLTDSLRQAAGGLPVNALADAGQAAGAAAPAAEPATDEDRAERRRSDSPVAVTSALESSGSGAFAAKAEEGELETLPATAVPGLELIQVTSIGQGTTFLGTHTMQRLEGGGVLDVFNLEPEVEPSVLPDREVGDNEVTLETEEGWIVVRGPRSEDELRELLEQLLPGSLR